MLNFALQHAYQITRATAIQLNVYNENFAAKQCYEKVCLSKKSLTKKYLNIAMKYGVDVI